MKKSGKINWWLYIGIALGVIGVVFAGLYGFGVLQTGETGFTETEELPTTYDFLVLDYATGEEVDNEDHDILLYQAEITDLDADEIADLEYADYELDDTLESGDSYTPDADYIYYALLNGSDIVSQWFVPVLGENILYAMNMTEDVAMLAYTTDGLVSTINQTDVRDWTIMSQTLDEEGELTSKEGYLPYYDFEDGEAKSVVLRIEFNTTADLAWASFESEFTNTEKASGVYIYYEISVTLIGTQDLAIRLGSGIGVDFEVIGMSLGYGSAADLTVWDSQN